MENYKALNFKTLSLPDYEMFIHIKFIILIKLLMWWRPGEGDLGRGGQRGRKKGTSGIVSTTKIVQISLEK